MQEESELPDYPTARWSLKKLDNGRIASHKKMSSSITKTFHQVKNPTGFSWKLTPPEIRKRYFEEFRKYFSWPKEWETIVHEKWEERAQIRYSDFIHDVKELRLENDEGRPLYISEEMWRGLCKYWDLPEVKARSEAARRCRMASANGSGTIPGTHRGGSLAVDIRAQEMAEKEGIPMEKCIYPSFRSIHMKKDGTYTTRKAAEIDAKVQEIAREQGEGADLSKIYIEVNGGGFARSKGCTVQAVLQLFLAMMARALAILNFTHQNSVIAAFQRWSSSFRPSVRRDNVSWKRSRPSVRRENFSLSRSRQHSNCFNNC